MDHLQIALKPAKSLVIILGILHGGAIIALLIATIPWYLRVLGLGACLFSFLITEMRYALLNSKKAITHIWADSAGVWYLKNNSAVTHVATIRGDSYITPFLVILNFNVEGQRSIVSIVLLADAFLYKDSFRQLRSYLIQI